jgi:hypothetical protein
MKPTDFPPFPAASEAKHFSVKATDLRRLVAQTAFAASRENSQYARAAVLFRVGGGRLELVATDARRLAMARCPVEGDERAAAMIPVGMAKMLTMMLSEAAKDETLSVALGDRQAVFQYDHTTVATGLMEGEFPAHEQIAWLPRDRFRPLSPKRRTRCGVSSWCKSCENTHSRDRKRRHRGAAPRPIAMPPPPADYPAPPGPGRTILLTPALEAFTPAETAGPPSA